MGVEQGSGIQYARRDVFEIEKGYQTFLGIFERSSFIQNKKL